MRAIVAVACVGLLITALGYVLVDKEVDGVARQRLEQPSKAALLGADRVSSAVDQILATANGVIVATGLDPERFNAALAADVLANPTLSGLALLTDASDGPAVMTTIGTTPLLASSRAKAMRAGRATRLVAHARDGDWSRLGFAARTPGQDAVTYLEVRLPVTSAGAPFALVDEQSSGVNRIVLGNVRTTDGLTAAPDRVAFGGRQVALFVDVAPIERGWFGISLPTLTLLVGIVLTAAAGVVAASVLRRRYAVAALGAENRALDEALTQQQKIETELRASQERFRAILRDTPDTIAFFDPDAGSCEVLNRTEFLGHPLATVAATGGLAGLVHPDDAAAAAPQFARLRALEQLDVCETTLRLRTAGGAYRYVRMRSSPVDGEQPGRRQLVQFSDVTDVRSRQVRQRELEDALHRAQRWETVGSLAGGIAHDFNNILAVVLGCSEMLIDDIADPEQREYARDIEQAAQRGSDLVRRLLGFAGRDRAEPRVVDLNDVVREMEPLLRRTLDEHIDLVVTTTDRPCTVVADPVQLEQVVLNLAVNARDAMPDGGTLQITSSVDRDTTGAHDYAGRVVLSVCDSGVGIEPALRERLFEPFATTKPGGTGLGLATVQSIVEAAGGWIAVTSERGVGSTFDVTLPHCRADSAEVPLEAPTGAAKTTGTRILLVEDEEAVRRALARNMERAGFDVTSASDATTALQILAGTHAFDVVVTDAIMPGMSGVELVDRLHREHPGLPLVLMTGYSQEIFADDPRASAARRLRKPFTSEQLLDAVYDVMRASDATDHALLGNR
jgi:PAS domain S-box-containing protein